MLEFLGVHQEGTLYPHAYEAAQGNRKITGLERESLLLTLRGWLLKPSSDHGMSVSDPIPIAVRILLSDHCTQNLSIKTSLGTGTVSLSCPQSWTPVQ